MSSTARTVHTLGEILLDHRTTEDKVRGAARSAPFWVIAVTGHLVLAFVLGMVVLRHEIAKEAPEAMISALQSAEKDLKIDEKPEAPPPQVMDPLAIPRVEEVDPNLKDLLFDTTCDLYVDPDATEVANPGIDEGFPDVRTNVWSTSIGGKNLAGAIGGGSGSDAGSGAPKGRPGGGIRSRVINSQKPNFTHTQKTVMAGLEWLRRHQSPDGSWDCDGFSANCDAHHGAACTGRGSAVFDAGVTGLALLAFLGVGADPMHEGSYRDTVFNGLKYLKNVQDAEGCFGSTGDNRHTYSHACATIAMCEAYAATKQLMWRRSAEAAVKYINECQNPYKAWRYGKKPGDNDTSVTGWMLMALKSAKDAGIPINERTMKDGLAFIDSVTDQDTGRTGYIKTGELPVRPEGLVGKWPANESEALTAVAMCSRVFCDASDTPMMKAGAELLAKKLPVWDEAKGTIDMYYWYYGTLVLHQMGGEHWERWNKNLKTAVIDNQIRDGCTEGSWDPKDPWGDDGGRVYSTALMTLCMEVYYRYPKVFGTSKK